MWKTCPLIIHKEVNFCEWSEDRRGKDPRRVIGKQETPLEPLERQYLVYFIRNWLTFT